MTVDSAEPRDESSAEDRTEADAGEGGPEPATETDGSLLGGEQFSAGYSMLLLAFGALGAIALLFGAAGTVMTLTGSFDSGEESDVLGAFECEEFEHDPQVVHDAEYAVERQVLSPALVSEFDGTVTDGGVEIALVVEGVFLDASANEVDGTPISLDSHDDGVDIERDTVEPFRLWVDVVDEDGAVTRMQLDICPPES